MMNRVGFGGFLTFTIMSAVAFGQPPQGGAQNAPGLGGPQGNAQALPINSVRPDYILGPNDQILIRVPQSDEINERPFRIDTDGFINLPLVGRVRAGGVTVQALEADLTTRLREYIREPVVGITVTQFRSEPVFFLGAFRVPGLYPLQGRRTLVEMLAYIGGLQPNASRRIKVQRRSEYGSIPLPNAVVDPDKKVSSVEISLDSLTQNINPEEDLLLEPFDVITSDRAERVYMFGEIGRIGAIELAERPSISVIQALTEAGGFKEFASRDKVRILRPILGTNRRAEIEIDVKRVLEGKDVDFPLLPNDALVVSRSYARATFIPIGTAMIGSIPFIIITSILR
ncbi:MAG: polysaccharide export protein [Acidobacteriia bacterium]|nr:polysaccharide export protein [Terriglobia bacterium]